jgi:hypothetical protein
MRQKKDRGKYGPVDRHEPFGTAVSISRNDRSEEKPYPTRKIPYEEKMSIVQVAIKSIHATQLFQTRFGKGFAFGFHLL